MITVMKDWDINIYNSFTQMESGADEDYEMPMPIFVSGSY
jgi:hypothetical protein